tara:strand:+ start:9740 stop:10378 length:639 start_codon:yes stop_codon:yes gene_type:complete
MKETVNGIAKKARLGTAVRTRGKARVSDILGAAQTILANEGLANLTIRSVSEALGISVGNLVYYFPSKDDLLQALIEHVIEGYDEELRRETETFPDDPQKRFKTFVRYLIEDTKRPEVRGFFYQLWGLSTHDVQVAKKHTKSYQHILEKILELLRDVHPEKSANALENMALGFMVCVEGLHVVNGVSDIDRIHSPSFDKHIFKQLLVMVEIS